MCDMYEAVHELMMCDMYEAVHELMMSDMYEAVHELMMCDMYEAVHELMMCDMYEAVKHNICFVAGACSTSIVPRSSLTLLCSKNNEMILSD